MMGQDDDDDGDHEHQHADGCCSHDHQHPHSHGHNAEGTHEHLNNGKHAKSAHDIENDEGDSSEDEENGTADLVYPAAYGPAVAEVLSACSTPLKVQDIKLPNAELQLNLAVSLWKEGVICVHTSKKSAKKARK